MECRLSDLNIGAHLPVFAAMAGGWNGDGERMHRDTDGRDKSPPWKWATDDIREIQTQNMSRMKAEKIG